jgi:phage-related protein
MRMWVVEFYETESGATPVEDFLNALDIKMRAKALHELEILEEFGRALREPYAKYIHDGIFELRIQLANNISRMFYFFFDGERIIVTNGFVKKSQKTPPREIERAEKYKADYQRRAKTDETIA